MNQHFESLYPPESWNKEIKQILTFVREGNSCQIIGLPGVGRSNLLKILSYNKGVLKHHAPELTQWMLFVLVDFSEIKNKPLVEVNKFLFLSILDSLREQGRQEEYEKVDTIFKEALNPSDELVLFNGLKRAIDFLSIEKELTVVFLFDKFEFYIKTVSNDLFSELAILRNRAKYRFSTIFSLDRPLEDYFDPSFMENLYPTLAGHDIYLPLSDKTSIEFRITYIQKTTGKTLPEDIKKQIFDLTGGHGNYTRIAVEELCSSEFSIFNFQFSTQKLFEFLINNRAIRAASYELWETLTAEEQRFLISIIARNEETKQSFSYLEQCGLLKNNHITIPLFEDFVRFRAEQKTVEKISFDLASNEIKKGEFSISDQLTGLEFRLLKFFLENENTILNREVIINSVWKDNASTAGVTDQALDQLIFRVRRKIEDDPNNPIHLQTIKGRGFKFTS